MLDKLGKVLGDYLIVKLGQELRDQGHNLTGDLIGSLEYRVRSSTGKMVVEFLANDYGVYLNTGVSASRIPHSPRGRRRGGTSLYIQGLIRYAERRMGLRGREAVGVAFAIARAHKREGMPTSASYRYSKNKRRTGWVDAILKQEEAEIERVVREFVGRELDILLTNFIRQAA